MWLGPWSTGYMDTTDLIHKHKRTQKREALLGESDPQTNPNDVKSHRKATIWC